MEQSDETLMALVAGGDKRAAGQLMHRYLPKIHGMGMRMLGRREDAEDLSQDVFLKVWSAAARWEAGRAKFSTWLHRVSLNACYDRLKKHRERLPGELPEIEDEGLAPAGQLHRDQQAAKVKAALQGLPERQRSALELCHFQELSQKEAADVLDISEEALESLLARGRRGLKTALIDGKDDLLGSMGQE